MTDAVMNAIDLRRKLQQHDRLTAPAYIRQWREQQFWFDNLIQNGGMDSDTVWLKGANWSIASGLATHTSGASATLDQSFSVHLNTHVAATFSISGRTAGNITPRLIESAVGTTDLSAAQAANGTFTAHGYRAIFDGLRFAPDSLFDGSLDNVSLFESDGTDIIHRLPQGWLPADVLVDGLLIREGAAHDYTVETDGFDTWIKPAVAPGALTETCIKAVRKV